jgi:hypothetical protein
MSAGVPCGRRPRWHNQPVADDRALRQELQATIDARRELGGDMEPALVDAFVARIEQRIAGRNTDSELALQRRREHQKEMVLGGMAISIPMLAIAAVFTGLAGVIVVCTALVVIALVTAR